MTSVHVDASVALKWLVAEDGSDQAYRLLDDGIALSAPELILSEVANALWKKSRANSITGEQAQEAIEKLPRFFRDLSPSASLIGHAMKLSLDHGHPVYDLIYVAHARHHGEQLVTADRRLLAKVASTSLAPHVVALGSWPA